MTFEQLINSINSVVIFKNITQSELVVSLKNLLYGCVKKQSANELIPLYSQFISDLYKKGSSFSRVLLDMILEDENIYISLSSNGGEIPGVMYECVSHEFAVLQAISSLTSYDLKRAIGYDGYLPDFETEYFDIKAMYAQRLCDISIYGYGMFVKNSAFMLRDSTLTAVLHPDTTRLCDLFGYELERQPVIDNTLAFLDNKPFNNVLLYGDCGTGKSSTVKAIVNEYFDRGLRLIELKKNELHLLPSVIEQIATNPLKFIIFIDDLSFGSDDNDFGALKAVLEGTVAAAAPNMAIYATSNRRHLVKERFSDRSGDDIHASDTRQELMSLSERFGITVTFSKPEKKLYLQVVSELAKKYGIDMPLEELFIKAEAFAISKGGRSPRGAKQFIESLAGKKD